MKDTRLNPNSAQKSSRTRLDHVQYEYCLEKVSAFLKNNRSIRNRELREIASVGYDQAIDFFTKALKAKRLVRLGTGSSTAYLLPPKLSK